MDHEQLRDHIDSKFGEVKESLNRVEDKLDNHLERISVAENSIEWIKGHLRISITMLIAVVGYLLSRFFDITIR